MKRIYDYNAETYSNYKVTDAVKVGVATTKEDIITRCFFKDNGAVVIIAEDLFNGALYEAEYKFSDLDSALIKIGELLEILSTATSWTQVVYFLIKQHTNSNLDITKFI